MSLIESVYIATCLDGFIARENDGLDWLDAYIRNGFNKITGRKG
jgi:hypothetical protein